MDTSPGFLNRSSCGLFKLLMLAANLDPEPGGEKSAEDKGVPDKENFGSFNVFF